ncbi:MAG: methionine gamma-lyase family protein [Oscillospiraceae bacterium]|nr:methionine gamma-lyase family protein [Oscillospiraceae bacterium]
MRSSEIRPEVIDLARRAEALSAPQFALLQEICEANTQRVMDAFQEYRVSEACFAGTTGYGYDDLGRETLEKIYARVFGTEAALVRPHFVNGTHAITAALFALCRPGEAILAATGKPYDTLHHAIGITGEEFGSLQFYGIGYRQVDLLPDGQPDLPGIRKALEDPTVKAVTLQRSIGYSTRKALSIEQIQAICMAVKEKRKDVSIFVDNCYGEFTDILEPTHVGADLIAGSLIKNPGGGLAPTGGYIAGKAELVERAASRMTLPGIGGECGSMLGISRLLFQGFFMAPHVVMQAMKTAVFAAAMMYLLGYDSHPRYDEKRSDIIQRISLGSPEKMEAFCRGIQAGAPVDSFVSPVPAPMPGYDCDVIMAAGAFIQGSSIELSCDGPVRDPYCVYLQGGLTYESGKLGVMKAVNGMLIK